MAERLYYEIAEKLSDDYIDLIIKYYRGWKSQQIIDIKYRFIKIFARNINSRSSDWYLLHQLVNKRRIDNNLLPKLINAIIDQGIIPLRVFHSTTEWLAPDEVWENRHHHPRIIRSGFVPFENDDDLATSLKTAIEVSNLLPNCYFVFSGNKSIHSWYPVDFSESLKDVDIADAKQRETTERNLRYELFHRIQKQTSYTLDNRISADPRRVVPVIGTLNALTGRSVFLLPNDLETLSEEDIIQKSQPEGWN